MFNKPAEVEPPLACTAKLGIFMAAHWRGVFIIIYPIILAGLLLINQPIPGWKWCAFTLLLMAGFWVTECIPLPVTSFFPLVIFPFSGVMTTNQTCGCYLNDSVFMFVSSLMLAVSVEQSGLHKRMAYFAIRMFGYSHYKLLLAMCIVTTFVSLWISNTAATVMMLPINFALLEVFEEQGILKMYDIDSSGEKVASSFTTCYFCAAAYSATIGGCGTLVGTSTNLVFKGLFMVAYPLAPEYLSFPLFSAFAMPYIIVLEALTYLYLCVVYFGMFRRNSAAAKATKISQQAKIAAKKVIDEEAKKLGKITFWEVMVIILFGSAMVGFFSRSPQLFTGWGDMVNRHYDEADTRLPTADVNAVPNRLRDSTLAALVVFLMLLLPSSLDFFKNFTVKFNEDLPKGPVRAVLRWKEMCTSLPFGFMFLLGGGFALSTGASTSGLNKKIAEQLQSLKVFPNIVVLLIIIMCVIFATNFATNVVIANVFVPIAIQLAKVLNQNPLWYTIAAGYTASWAFMIPVGTPPNLIIASAARISTKQMIVAGAGPTIIAVVVTLLAVYFYAPVIWPDLHTMPNWAL